MLKYQSAEEAISILKNDERIFIHGGAATPQQLVNTLTQRQKCNTIGGILQRSLGLALTAIFVSLSVLGAVITRDKAKGIGIAIMMWLFFSLLYDGLILLIMFQFSDYPLEKAMVVFCSLNPVDLARILILLKLDISAMMGYTGAIFNQFFGNNAGIIYSTFIMMLWVGVPLFIALRKFRRKDL